MTLASGDRKECKGERCQPGVDDLILGGAGTASRKCQKKYQEWENPWGNGDGLICDSRFCESLTSRKDNVEKNRLRIRPSPHIPRIPSPAFLENHSPVMQRASTGHEGD